MTGPQSDIAVTDSWDTPHALRIGDGTAEILGTLIEL